MRESSHQEGTLAPRFIGIAPFSFSGYGLVLVLDLWLLMIVKVLSLVIKYLIYV